MKMLFSLSLTLLLVCLPAISLAQPAPIVSLESREVIWGFDFINDKSLVATTREGNLLLVDLSTGKPETLNAPEAFARSQGGLLDVKVVTLNNRIYLYSTYSKKMDDGTNTTALARAEFQTQQSLNWEELFIANAFSKKSKHYGSRLLFVDDRIFMTIGDRGMRDTVQSLSNHRGKVLRLTLDGKPAPGNPFADTKDALPEIWTLGHRNPQGISYDPASKRIYVAEFGPRGGDEINILQPGKNYGWPLITYGRNYIGTSIGPAEKEGLEQPFIQWTPSISPSGLLFTDSKIYITALSGRNLIEIPIVNGNAAKQKRLLPEKQWRVRHVETSPSGEIYFSTDSGEIFKL